VGWVSASPTACGLGPRVVEQALKAWRVGKTRLKTLGFKRTRLHGLFTVLVWADSHRALSRLPRLLETEPLSGT